MKQTIDNLNLPRAASHIIILPPRHALPVIRFIQCGCQYVWDYFDHAFMTSDMVFVSALILSRINSDRQAIVFRMKLTVCQSEKK
jgi:hypothetical protein